jgi:AraC-like DNA-binding protein
MLKIITSYFIILFLIFYVSVFKTHAQSKYEDTLINELNINGNFQKSIQVARFNFIKANSNDKKLYYNNCIIRAYANMGNNDSTLIYIKNALELLPSVQDSELICYTYLRLGLSYKNCLDINNSIKYLLNASNLAKKLNLTIILVKVFSELGNLIENQNGNLNHALYYLNLSIKYANSKNFDLKNSINLKELITVLLSRSSLYNSLDKMNESFNDLNYAVKLLKNMSNNGRNKILINMQLSQIYAANNDKKNSDKFISEALRISLINNSIPYIVDSYRIKATNSYNFEDYNNAIFYFLKAENYDDKNREHLVGKIFSDSLLYVSYKNIGDNMNALKYYQSFINLKNKYYDKSRINELNKLEIKFQLEENEKKLVLKNLEQTKDRAIIQFLILFILITIILILVVLGYKHLENKRKKLIFRNIENSDKEINSIKGWQEWRNNFKIVSNNDNSVSTAVDGNNLNNSHIVMIHRKATNESEITVGAIGENNIDFEVNKENYTGLYFELRELLETKKLYLNPNLILEDLIKELGTNKKYLYYAIKSNYEDNFKSLLSDYRINHVKSLIVESIKTKKKIRMEEIQESSGFQSNASFFRVFKSKTGLTPLEYADQVKLSMIKISNYNLNQQIA